MTLREVSYCRDQDGAILEFRGVVGAPTDKALDDLAAALRDLDNLPEFQLSRVSK
jgi:hypothetical protein